MAIAVARPVRVPGLVGWFGLAAVAALAVSVRLPVQTTVLGLATFGILHNVLELRYVAGRFSAVLAGPFLALLVTLITGIMLCRLFTFTPWSRPAEIVLAYVLLAMACGWALRSRPALLATALSSVAAAALVSLSFPAYHFVVLAHLHNVVPLFFLWEWARELPGGRTTFRLAQVGWVLVIPALILAGAFDSLLVGGSVAAFGAAYTPPAWLATSLALRFLVVFAFMQTMHYVVWVWFMPRYAPAATARFEERAPFLDGRRAWALGVLGALLLAILFTSDYAAGKSVYAAVASYHAYLEFPVLLALVLGVRRLVTPGEPS